MPLAVSHHPRLFFLYLPATVDSYIKWPGLAIRLLIGDASFIGPFFKALRTVRRMWYPQFVVGGFGGEEGIA